MNKRLKKRQLTALGKPLFLISEAAWIYAHEHPVFKTRVSTLTDAIDRAKRKMQMAGADFGRNYTLTAGSSILNAISALPFFRADSHLPVNGREVGVGVFMGCTVFALPDTWFIDMAIVRDSVRSVHIKWVKHESYQLLNLGQ